LGTRWSEHKTPSATTLFSKAVKKHGPDSFSLEVLHECETKEEMDFVEMFYISFLGTKSPKGYNLSDGGGRTTLGLKMPTEAVEKMRQAKLGKKQSPEHTAKRNRKGRKHAKHTEETKQLLSKKLTGPANANFGHPHSEEHNQKIRESNTKAKPWHHGTGTAYQKYKCRCEVCVGPDSWYQRMINKRENTHGARRERAA
jgi:group I intron endonuclease